MFNVICKVVQKLKRGQKQVKQLLHLVAGLSIILATAAADSTSLILTLVLFCIALVCFSIILFVDQLKRPTMRQRFNHRTTIL